MPFRVVELGWVQIVPLMRCKRWVCRCGSRRRTRVVVARRSRASMSRGSLGLGYRIGFGRAPTAAAASRASAISNPAEGSMKPVSLAWFAQIPAKQSARSSVRTERPLGTCLGAGLPEVAEYVLYVMAVLVGGARAKGLLGLRSGCGVRPKRPRSMYTCLSIGSRRASRRCWRARSRCRSSR